MNMKTNDDLRKKVLLNNYVLQSIIELQEQYKENPYDYFDGFVEYILNETEKHMGARSEVDYEHMFNTIQWIRHFGKIVRCIASGEDKL